MAFAPIVIGRPKDLGEATRVIENLQDALRIAFEQQEVLILQKLNAEPFKKVDGQVSRADGTNWDPGSGAGVYWWDAIAMLWRFLG